ncbi:MAG: penicillin-binding protein 2 [Bacilli bacterium]|nr:penicillin-binding protein 2 [Bacilli bacterium]
MRKKKKVMPKKTRSINYDYVVKNRFIVFLIFIIIIFIILLAKLFNVMIIENDKYNDKIDVLTYVKTSGESAPRGRILDRNYNVIVDNIAVKTITYSKRKDVSTKQMLEAARTLSRHVYIDISKLTERSKKEYYIAAYPEYCNKLIKEKEYELLAQKKLTSNDIYELKVERITDKELSKLSEEDLHVAQIFYLMNSGYAYSEKIIKSNVSDEEYAYVSENNASLYGFNTSVSWERTYPYGDTLKSILGTVSSTKQGIPAEEKDYYLSLGYSLNDRVGLSYIEKEYENYLKGEKPEYEVVSSTETKLIKEGKRGNDIVLSIDIHLQQEVERIIENNIWRCKGEANSEYYDHSSVILQDPNTGEILVMASKKLVDGVIVDNVRSILTNPITPGSVVKGASMLVAYNTGAVHFGERVMDEPIKVAGVAEKSSYHNLGVIDDITALAQSSNVYQFKAAIRVNGQEYHRNMKLNFNQSAFDTYRTMYHSFGLGVKTGIDLPVESSGYGAKKDKAAGNLLDYVIGQYESFTPLQLSQYVSTIANGGNRMQTHLLKEVRESTDSNELGKVIFTYEPNVLNTINTSRENMDRVRYGFWAVLNASNGYGRGYMEEHLRGAGKTGTSQSFIDTDGNGVIDTETITTSFVGYAPYDNPKVSIEVSSPNVSHPNPSYEFTSLVSYRIVREVMSTYYNYYGI